MKAKLIIESLDFERGKTPQSAMGLGLKGQIGQWLDKNYNMDYDQPGVLEAILEDVELDKETREAWTKFMLSEGYDFDENEWYDMQQQQIDVLEFVPDGQRDVNDIELTKLNGEFEVSFGAWSAFADFLDDQNYNKYASQLLDGDAWEFFEHESDHYEINEIKNWVRDHNIDLDQLKEKFEKLGGEDLDNMFDEIDENEDLEDLKIALKNTAADTQSSANEGEAYKSVMNTIINHYGLRKGEWEDTGTYTAPISKEGARKLLDFKYQQEAGIDYYFDKEYYGDWDEDSFEMALENKLSDL